MDERMYQRLYISLMPGLSASEASRIETGSHVSVIEYLKARDISYLIGRSYQKHRLDRDSIIEKAHQILEDVENGTYTVRTVCEEGYPSLLRNIYDPPYLLYLSGSLPPEESGIAIVGTRRASTHALRRSYQMAALLGLHGIPVISGLAYGIDSAAHRGAVDAGGRTWAVIGSGLDRIYPKEHIGLAEKMIESGGGLISEFPPDMGPQRWTFPKRNRIVSGMSHWVYLMEAPLRSGAMITADFALEQGRDVFVDGMCLASSRSTGTQRLAEEGAQIIDSSTDLLRACCGNDTISYQVTEQRPPDTIPVFRTIRYGSARYHIWRSHGA